MPQPIKQWVSPEAVHFASKALVLRDRPDFPNRLDITTGNTPIYWKTGTSQGRKDAWSIGYNTHYTVAVWFGNLDNLASPALVGSQAAAPVMFRIFELLKGYTAPPPSKIPIPQLDKVEICSFSGYLAGEACQKKVVTDVIHGHHPKEKCPYHRQVLVDATSQLRLTRSCSAGFRAIWQSFLELPHDVTTLLGDKLPEMTSIPRFHPNCDVLPVEETSFFKIKQPKNQNTYYVLASMGKKMHTINVEIDSNSSPYDISCFLNGKQLAQTTSVLELEPNHYTLFCNDVNGQSDHVAFDVKRLE